MCASADSNSGTNSGTQGQTERFSWGKLPVCPRFHEWPVVILTTYYKHQMYLFVERPGLGPSAVRFSVPDLTNGLWTSGPVLWVLSATTAPPFITQRTLLMATLMSASGSPSTGPDRKLTLCTDDT